ncbi:hypothetical protein K438DRAFT_2014494, partial [Mycena galopus ATCC 62051]
MLWNPAFKHLTFHFTSAWYLSSSGCSSPVLFLVGTAAVTHRFDHKSTIDFAQFPSVPSGLSRIVSDERSVEAQLLGLLNLSLGYNLIDPITDSSCCAEVDIPEYITTILQNTAECSPSFDLRRLARLGLAVSSRTRTGSFSFNPLALEVCTCVHDAISGSFPRSHLHALTSLLQDIEAFSSRNRYFQIDQVQEYRRRLGCILDDASEEITVSSTSVQVREADSSARRIRYPSASNATATYPNLSSESLDPSEYIFTKIYSSALFIYHIILLRLPTTFNSLAVESFLLRDGEDCQLESWASFIDILLQQWKTLGLFSTLIFGATLTMFQIDAVVDNLLLHIVVHHALLCVMMSLIYISLLSVYFGGWCRSNSVAMRWMQDMRTSNPYTFWNFWVLISLPAVWTCWGIFLFLVSMILFIWPLS